MWGLLRLLVQHVVISVTNKRSVVRVEEHLVRNLEGLLIMKEEEEKKSYICCLLMPLTRLLAAFATIFQISNPW